MKDIPDLIFTFLKEDPTIHDDELFVGLGAFPNKGKEPPTVLESLKPIEIDQLEFNDWRDALDATWDSAYADEFDAAVFKDSIAEAVAALIETQAERKVLVVFGDSMLDFPGGDEEWSSIMPDSYGVSPLMNILENRNDDAADDVELHYVQYDCLPDETTKSFMGDSYWTNGISNWQQLQSKEDLEDIDQIDDETLVVNELIRIYGWKWYGNSAQQPRVDANLKPPKPPSWHVPSLIKGLIGNFLPATHISDSNLWKRQRFTGDPDAIKMEIPVPGYAAGVTIHMLGFDEGWCVDSGRRNDEKCESSTQVHGNLTYKTFELSLRSPNNSCEGSMITLSPDDAVGSALKYPALVWWEITPMIFPLIVGEISNVQFNSYHDTEVIVPSRTTIDLYVEWYEFNELTRDEQDFLNNCYLIDIVPGGTATEMTTGELTLPRVISLPFDPGANPTLGFDLAFDIVIRRRINVPNFTSTPYEAIETLRLIGSERGLPVAHFEFSPTLAGTPDTDRSGSKLSYTIPVLYTGPGYYPDGIAPDAPMLFALRRDYTSTTPNTCMAATTNHDRIFTFEQVSWVAKSLREGEGKEHLVKEGEKIIEPSETRPEFEIPLFEPEIKDCSYEYLLIYWENDAFTPIACNLIEEDCEQSLAFAAPDDNAPVTDNED